MSEEVYFVREAIEKVHTVGTIAKVLRTQGVIPVSLFEMISENLNYVLDVLEMSENFEVQKTQKTFEGQDELG